MTDFNFIEAMKVRRSVRTFDPKRPIERSLMEEIGRAISDISNPFGVDEIKLSLVEKSMGDEAQHLGTYGVIKGASAFVGMALPDSLPAYLAGGYVFERLVLYMTSLGLGTVWLGATLNRSGFSDAMKVPEGYTLPVISPVGYGVSPRFKEKIMRRFVNADNRKPWPKLFFDGAPDTPLTAEVAGDYAEPLEMVRLAPSATNTQPWRVVREGGKFHFFAEYPQKAKGQELRFRHIDLGIALCHFDLACRQLHLPCAITTTPPPALSLPADWHYIATVNA